MTVGHDARAPLWRPSDSNRVSHMERFTRFASARTKRDVQDYHRLWQWSTEDLGAFWTAVWEFHNLDTFFGEPGPALRGDTMPGATWFPTARLNLAEYLLGRGADDEFAVIGATEDGTQGSLTWGELRSSVAGVSTWLREQGVRPGDRVAGFLPNCPEAVVAFLATVSIGAVWASVGQDYGASAVIDRFAQLEPKVLIAADGYVYGGKQHDRTEEIARIRESLPSVEAVAVVSRIGVAPIPESVDFQGIAATPARLSFERVSFDHPLWVMFSSGTTGLPKGIVHGHGGILLEQLKFTGLHNDIGPGDTFFWYTSPSWVMWNILACALATGAAIVCYDGAPQQPEVGNLWRIVAEHRVTVFGSSPGYLDACRKAGIEPANEFELGSLRLLATSGAPLGEETHRWAADATGGLPLFSVSGGTDIASAFCGGTFMAAIRAGEIPVRNLGVALESRDPDGAPLVDRVGEMVVTRPMPSMPVRFWNDPEGKRYLDAYYRMFPGVWRHGDWITLTSDGAVVVHGRSDSTLNRHGVRMGSSDIYNVMESFAEFSDSLILGVEDANGGYWMPLFVVLAPGAILSGDLTSEVARRIRAELSPRHVPDEIIQVEGLPHTRTGKRLEVPLKRVMQGADPQDVIQFDAVDAPEHIAAFVDIARARVSALQSARIGATD